MQSGTQHVINVKPYRCSLSAHDYKAGFLWNFCKLHQCGLFRNQTLNLKCAEIPLRFSITHPKTCTHTSHMRRILISIARTYVPLISLLNCSITYTLINSILCDVLFDYNLVLQFHLLTESWNSLWFVFSTSIEIPQNFFVFSLFLTSALSIF